MTMRSGSAPRHWLGDKDMEVFEIILTFLAEVSWPVSVFLTVYFAIYSVRQGWIGSIKAWNSTGGFEVMKPEEEFVERAQKTLETAFPK